ncbi:MAG TPA: hypothetical protein VHB45_11610 [Alloacidobacterium sp.]|nr:hypothetical protein [Alloacidobacterium sp.]
MRRRAQLLLSTVFITTSMVLAQQPATDHIAPVPAKLYTAKKIFLSNAGADSGLFPHPFSGAPDRGYNQLYAALQSSGQFTLVSDPEDADLVLQLELIEPNGPKYVDKTKGSSDPFPMFRLTIFDRGTHYILWTFTESIEGAYLQKTHDRNFDDALKALMTDFKNLVSQKAGKPS